MKYALALVEGQTEETFIRDVLNPYLESKNIFLTPKIITTKRVKKGPDFKGGITDYQKVKKEVRLLLGDTSVVAVTTMIDYYGLPNDFPGVSSNEETNCYSRVRYVEDKFLEDISHSKFVPFLTLHEFEAYLFVSPAKIANTFPDENTEGSFTRIRDEFATPEEINERNSTHPSARIRDILPSFRKAIHGPMIARRIGLELIKEECSHFNDWISTLESL